MVGAGFLMVFLALYGLFLAIRDKFGESNRFLRLLPFAIVLPYVASATGWLMTELGRQPWIVFGLMRTENGVSPTVAGTSVLLSLVLFTAVYGLLMAADIYLLNKHAKDGPVVEGALEPVGAY
jgi:cytochrome d ubiquinol oxidase subunit I